MFTSILSFVLGFLSAGLIALLIAPPIWRRAVALTKKRVEATVPLTMNEIQADKDRLRAEFALSTRRLEMSVQGFRERASEQIVEITRNREDLKRLTREREEAGEAIADLEAKGVELRAALSSREEELERMTGRLGDADRRLDERARELQELNRLYNETSLNASNRQIELVARETEVEKLASEIAVLRSHRRDQEQRMREIGAASKNAEDVLRVQKKRTADLDAKLERLMAEISERDEKLDRRDREISRLRDEVKLLSGSEMMLAEELTRFQSNNLQLEAEIADMSIRIQSMTEEKAKNGDIAGIKERLDRERAQLEQKLTDLARENETLRKTLGTLEKASVDGWNDERQESAALRERINDLAAEVVHLTMSLEGPNSPINAALGQNGGETSAPPPGGQRSIADRVRQLQKKAVVPYA